MRCYLMISALLALDGCGGEKTETVGRAEYGEKFPFTVEKVDLFF